MRERQKRMKNINKRCGKWMMCTHTSHALAHTEAQMKWRETARQLPRWRRRQRQLRWEPEVYDVCALIWCARCDIPEIPMHTNYTYNKTNNKNNHCLLNEWTSTTRAMTQCTQQRRETPMTEYESQRNDETTREKNQFISFEKHICPFSHENFSHVRIKYYTKNWMCWYFFFFFLFNITSSSSSTSFVVVVVVVVVFFFISVFLCEFLLLSVSVRFVRTNFGFSY